LYQSWQWLIPVRKLRQKVEVSLLLPLEKGILAMSDWYFFGNYRPVYRGLTGYWLIWSLYPRINPDMQQKRRIGIFTIVAIGVLIGFFLKNVKIGLIIGLLLGLLAGGLAKK
jgi:hypothetical protein